MRVIAASGVSSGDAVAEFLAKSDPTIAVVVAISPADACAVADSLSLRYAIQCWDAHEDGKAIFWKQSVALHGLYRAEFGGRQGRSPGGQRGLLRVTLLWDGRPLDVFCAHLSPTRQEADRQLVDVARELGGLRNPTILAISSASMPLGGLHGLVDMAKAAPWRFVVLPSERDISDTARGAFGLEPHSEGGAAHAPARAEISDALALWCSPDFDVVRLYDFAPAAKAATRRALVADLAQFGRASNDSDSSGGSSNPRRTHEPARTGTYSD